MILIKLALLYRSCIYVASLIHMCDMWHDSFICVPRVMNFIHTCVTCDMAHSYMVHDAFLRLLVLYRDLEWFVWRMTWLVHMCTMWHDSFICGTWHIRVSTCGVQRFGINLANVDVEVLIDEAIPQVFVVSVGLFWIWGSFVWHGTLWSVYRALFSECRALLNVCRAYRWCHSPGLFLSDTLVL